MGLDLNKMKLPEGYESQDNSDSHDESQNETYTITSIANTILPILRAEGNYIEYRGKWNTDYKNVMFFAKDRKKLYFNGVDYTEGIVDTSPYINNRTYLQPIDIDYFRTEFLTEKPEIIKDVQLDKTYDYYLHFKCDTIDRRNVIIKDPTKIIDINKDPDWNNLNWSASIDLNIQSYLTCLNYVDETEERESCRDLLYSNYKKANIGSEGEFVYGIRQVLPQMLWELSINAGNKGNWTGNITGSIGTYNQFNKNTIYFTTIKPVDTSDCIKGDSKTQSVVNSLVKKLDNPKIIFGNDIYNPGLTSTDVIPITITDTTKANYGVFNVGDTVKNHNDYGQVLCVTPGSGDEPDIVFVMINDKIVVLNVPKTVSLTKQVFKTNEFTISKPNNSTSSSSTGRDLYFSLDTNSPDSSNGIIGRLTTLSNNSALAETYPSCYNRDLEIGDKMHLMDISTDPPIELDRCLVVSKGGDAEVTYISFVGSASNNGTVNIIFVIDDETNVSVNIRNAAYFNDFNIKQLTKKVNKLSSNNKSPKTIKLSSSLFPVNKEEAIDIDSNMQSSYRSIVIGDIIEFYDGDKVQIQGYEADLDGTAIGHWGIALKAGSMYKVYTKDVVHKLYVAPIN